MRPRLALAVLLASLGALSGCRDDGSGGGAPLEALAAAKQQLATTSGVHLVIDAEGLPGSGRSLEHAEGDAQPPGSFRGSARVRSATFSATVKAVAVDGVLYVQQPFSSSYSKVSAASVGVPDPGQLLGAEGLPALLTSDPKARADGQVRVGAEVLDRYRLTAPDAGPLSGLSGARQIPTEADLDPATGQLRRLVLVGALFAPGTETTLTISFTEYGKQLDIRAP